MYTAPNANPGISAKDGLMAWAKGAQAWMDNRGRKAWIVATILGFIFAWPVGLGLLVYMIWSKRMFNRSCGMKSGYSSNRGGPWGGQGGPMGFAGTFRSSGNAAFDAYKADTIRRLQEEQDAFEAFLQRLRDAKDKSEFDSFMADRAKAAQTADVTKPADATEPKSDN
ncbi:MAG: DUF2852 domain-containing protein [Candidatus Saccharibacteria bacterium]|nr:DUF2852 domain-containing protein [Pseudorhodobacter sp.]